MIALFTFPLAVRVRLFELFINQLVNFLFIPFMALYFSRNYDVEVSGILMGIALSAGLVTAMIGGFFADASGRRNVVVTCEWLRALGLVIMAGAEVFSQPMIMFLAFTLVMAAGGAAYPAIQALIVDLTPAEQRKDIYLSEFMIYNLAIALGGLVGSAIFEAHKMAIFTTGAVVSLALGGLFYLTLPRELPPANEKPAISLSGMLRHYAPVFRDRIFLLFLTASILALLTERMIFNYLSVTLADMPAQESYVTRLLGLEPVKGIVLYGWLVASVAVFVVCFGLLMRMLTSRVSNDTLMFLTGIIVSGTCYGLMALKSDATFLLIMLFLATCGELVFWPIRQTLLADLTQTENRGAYMAANGLVYRAAMSLGPIAIIIGGAAGSFAVTASIVLCTFVCIALFYKVFAHRVTLPV